MKFVCFLALGGNPPGRCSHVQEHGLQRGREGRPFAIHLWPSGSFWWWNQADRVDKLSWPYSVWGWRMTPSTWRHQPIQGHCQPIVQNQAALVVQGKPAPGRRRIDSIVPGQLGQVPTVLQGPCWISGTESGAGGFGRGGRGSNRGQRWNRGRGSGNRSYPYWKAVG